MKQYEKIREQDFGLLVFEIEGEDLTQDAADALMVDLEEAIKGDADWLTKRTAISVEVVGPRFVCTVRERGLRGVGDAGVARVRGAIGSKFAARGITKRGGP